MTTSLPNPTNQQPLQTQSLPTHPAQPICQKFQCRICLQQYPTAQNLITPCLCIGSVQFVHQHCQIHWSSQTLKKLIKSQSQTGQPTTLFKQIQCQICHYQIKLDIQWQKKCIPFKQAKQQYECFNVLFIVCILKIIICIIGLLYLIVTALRVLTYDNNNKQQYKQDLQDKSSRLNDKLTFDEDPVKMWGITILGIVVFSIFLGLRIKQLYYMFMSKQFKIKKVYAIQNNKNNNVNNHYDNNNKIQQNYYITPRKVTYSFDFNDVILNNNNINSQYNTQQITNDQLIIRNIQNNRNQTTSKFFQTENKNYQKDRSTTTNKFQTQNAQNQ